MVQYDMNMSETWARSYSQYVTKKSGDEKLIAQLDSRRNDKFYAHTQWDDDDFAPIEQAIDKLFTRMGWLR